MNNIPEVEIFKIAQHKLLSKYVVAAKSEYVQLPQLNLTVHVLEAGKGDPVLLLHGGGAFAAQYAPLMGMLQKDFHLIAPDRPGCGLNDMINYDGIAFREHAVNFIDGILEHFNLKKASLIGNSMGGYWALLFALAHPERVSKLILIGEPAASSPPETIRPAPPADTNPSIENIKGAYGFVLVADINNVSTEILEADLAAVKIPGAALAWNSMINQFRTNSSLGTYTLRPELKNLKPQTLFIWGVKDWFGQPKLGQEMAALAPNAKCEIVSDAGHVLWLDQLEICISLINNFLRREA